MAEKKNASMEDSVRQYVTRKIEKTEDQEEKNRLQALLSEALSYSFLAGIIPENLPKISFDKDQGVLSYDQNGGLNSLWSEIVESRVDEVAVRQLAETMAKLHRSTLIQIEPPSTDDSLSPGNVHNITELRSSKFTDFNLNNEHTTDQQRSLLQDASTREKIQKLENIFMTKKQGVIHGSMNPACIHIRNGKPMLTNFSFCAPGPYGFDLGTLLASYMTLYQLHMLNPVNNDEHRKIAYKMMDACNNTVSTYVDEMKAVLTEKEIGSLISDAAGFAACELIRRSKTKWLHPGISEDLSSVRREMVDSAIRLLRQYQSIDDVGRLLMIGLMLC